MVQTLTRDPQKSLHFHSASVVLGILVLSNAYLDVDKCGVQVKITHYPLLKISLPKIPLPKRAFEGILVNLMRCFLTFAAEINEYFVHKLSTATPKIDHL